MSHSWRRKWTLSPISNLGFLYFRNGLLYRMDRKSEFLTFFGIKSIEHICRNSRFWPIELTYEFTCIDNLHVSVKHNFQGSYCTLSKYSRNLTHRTVNLYSFGNSPATSVPLSTQNLAVRFFFVILVKNERTVFVESLVFICLHLRLYQTNLDELVDTLHRFIVR